MENESPAFTIPTDVFTKDYGGYLETAQSLISLLKGNPEPQTDWQRLLVDHCITRLGSLLAADFRAIRVEAKRDNIRLVKKDFTVELLPPVCFLCQQKCKPIKSHIVAESILKCLGYDGGVSGDNVKVNSASNEIFTERIFCGPCDSGPVGALDCAFKQYLPPVDVNLEPIFDLKWSAGSEYSAEQLYRFCVSVGMRVLHHKLHSDYECCTGTNKYSVDNVFKSIQRMREIVLGGEIFREEPFQVLICKANLLDSEFSGRISSAVMPVLFRTKEPTILSLTHFYAYGIVVVISDDPSGCTGLYFNGFSRVVPHDEFKLRTANFVPELFTKRYANVKGPSPYIEQKPHVQKTMKETMESKFENSEVVYHVLDGFTLDKGKRDIMCPNDFELDNKMDKDDGIGLMCRYTFRNWRTGKLVEINQLFLPAKLLIVVADEEIMPVWVVAQRYESV